MPASIVIAVRTEPSNRAVASVERGRQASAWSSGSGYRRRAAEE
jgi:hypothetical protein